MTRVSGAPLARQAYQNHFAIPAFNVFNMESIQAVVAAAEGADAPVILQVSPGAIEYAGYGTITDLVLLAAERAAVPVVAHLDHCRDPVLVRRALDDGYGSAMFDGSTLSWAENVATTRELAATAAAHGAAIEAELGVIGGREDAERLQQVLTEPEEAAAFVAACPVDFLAPAIGALHRMPDDSVVLDVSRIAAISRACGRPIALHGGSGVRREQLPAIVAGGVGKVNISSRLNRAYAAGIRGVWEKDPAQLDMRRVLVAARDAIRSMAGEYFSLCGTAGRALVRVSAAPDWSSETTEVE